MKAFVLAAGLGTRLKPWTEKHPKALVPVGGVPMLERVICRLRDEGFDDITVNVHHFSDQILDFLSSKDFGVSIHVSDESERLLDTGGGLLKASPCLSVDRRPFLVHNVDILSDAPLADIMNRHLRSSRNISLVTSLRESTRKLVFDDNEILQGWHDLRSSEYRPDGFMPLPGMHEHAFSGIYVVDPLMFQPLKKYALSIGSDAFPIMDFFLAVTKKFDIGEIDLESLNLIDIGKPETLSRAESLFDKSRLEPRF